MTSDFKKTVFELTDLEPFRGEKPTRIGEEIRKAALENDALAQNIRLRKNTLIVLFSFLATETVIIFVFAYFQATKAFGFELDEWSFKLLTTATLLQITYMLQVAVQYLFPNGK